MRLHIFSVVLAGAVLGVDGSYGDSHHGFTSCLSECTGSCHEFDPKELPWALWLFQWTCESNCKHSCTTEHHQDRVDKGLATVKYFGKWPFKRILGMQELASAVFSVGNGLGHVWFLLNRHRMPKEYAARDAFIIYAFVAINTWLWSTAFHIRDTPSTERLDYYFALFHVAFSTSASLIRILGAKSVVMQILVLAPFLVVFTWHVRYMQYVQFDYGWNMQVNLAIGLIYIFSWLAWACATRRPYAGKIVAMVLLLPAMAGLEVFDFEPLWGILDAHACWHGATIPLVFLFYSFVFDDAQYEKQLGELEETSKTL